MGGVRSTEGVYVFVRERQAKRGRERGSEREGEGSGGGTRRILRGRAHPLGPAGEEKSLDQPAKIFSYNKVFSVI